MSGLKGGPEVVDTESEPWEPLQPYLVGDAGPNWARNPGINYNWLNAANQLAGGMPLESVPPMFMNDPRMTFEDVYTPYEGGPWGYGLSPGQLTAEAGIPGVPGDQFIEAPEDLVPGAPNNPLDDYNQPAPQQPTLGMTADMLLRAQRYYDMAARRERDAGEGYGSPYGIGTIMAAMQDSPDLTGRELDDAVRNMQLRMRRGEF